MITVTLCLAVFAVMAITGFTHYFYGPRSEKPLSDIAAYVFGVLPVIVAFGVVVVIDDPHGWLTVLDIVILFIAAAIFPVLGRALGAWQELQDYRHFQREERRHAEKNTI